MSHLCGWAYKFLIARHNNLISFFECLLQTKNWNIVSWGLQIYIYVKVFKHRSKIAQQKHNIITFLFCKHQLNTAISSNYLSYPNIYILKKLIKIALFLVLYEYYCSTIYKLYRYCTNLLISILQIKV